MKILKFLSLITLLIAPANVLGAEISLQTSRSAIGLNDQFIVNVVVDTEESINAIEGQIEIPSSILRVINILDGDSIINFWVEKPTETSANTITFSGITPGGFKGNNKLFSLTLEATTSGSDIISFKNTAALLHDGLGTKTSLTGKDFIISIYVLLPIFSKTGFK